MVKRVLATLLCYASIGALAGCGCEHEWIEATCTVPKTCSKCNQTEGDALGHQWTEATCIKPKTCRVCGETEGTALGHNWVEATCTTPKTCSQCAQTEGEALGHNVPQWEVTAATCAQEGSRTGLCARCQQTITETIPKLEHTPGDWQITKVATIDEFGMKEQYCTVCGARTGLDTYKYEVPLSELSTLAETVISAYFDHYNISSDESTSTVTINVWFDGLAMEVAYLEMLGGDSNSENWVDAKDGTVSMAKSIEGLFEEAGRSDTHLVINVLNDMDTSKTLLTILDGTIVYDCLA